MQRSSRWRPSTVTGSKEVETWRPKLTIEKCGEFDPMPLGRTVDLIWTADSDLGEWDNAGTAFSLARRSGPWESVPSVGGGELPFPGLLVPCEELSWEKLKVSGQVISWNLRSFPEGKQVGLAAKNRESLPSLPFSLFSPSKVRDNVAGIAAGAADPVRISNAEE